MSNTCVICKKPIDDKCTWSACVLANKLSTRRTVQSTIVVQYDSKFNPEWKQEIEKYPGRH